MKQISIFLMIWLMPILLMAQPMGNIRGIITDGASEQVLPYASVILLNTNPIIGPLNPFDCHSNCHTFGCTLGAVHREEVVWHHDVECGTSRAGPCFRHFYRYYECRRNSVCRRRTRTGPSRLIFRCPLRPTPPYWF